MIYEVIERPHKNRRHLNDTDLDWDQDVEDQLLDTLTTGKAIRLSLAKFHSSPAKGRLWAQGYRVLHRVLPNRQEVAAWLAPK